MRDWLALVRFRSLLGFLPVAVFLAVRSVAAPELAILAGFSMSVIVYFLTRGEAGMILALATFALGISAVTTAVALWQGSERLYFAGDPAWDFSLLILTTGSLLLRRPLARAIVHEAMPALRTTVPDQSRVFSLITLLAALMFLFHGVTRTALLMTDSSIERYLLVSRAIQWPSLVVLVLVGVWLLKRAMEQPAAAATTVHTTTHDRTPPTP